MTEAMQMKEALIQNAALFLALGAKYAPDEPLQTKTPQTGEALETRGLATVMLQIAAQLRALPSPAALDPRTVEACAKVADDFAAYEQTVIDRAHADEALSDSGREYVLSAAGSRQIAAEQIGHDIRALLAQPAPSGKPEPVAWRITDGEGDYDYHTNEPREIDVKWAARYGRKFEPLYAAPASNPQEADEEMVPKRLLNERDDFIVNKGLWSEFTDTLSSTDTTWHKIDSAPQDGRTIEVRFLTDNPRRVRWSQSDRGTYWHLADSHGPAMINFNPTEWRPVSSKQSTGGDK